MPDLNTLLVVTTDGMGQTDDTDLKRRLLGTYLTLLRENGTPPGAIAFYTDGVRLLVEDSPLLEPLAALEAEGVHLIGCKTCLDTFGLTDRVRVGIVGGMGDILAAQARATKVVHL